MATGISNRWRSLSGSEDWTNLLDPLDLDLRKYLIHYGERAQVTYDTFNLQTASRNEGNSIYSMEHLFENTGLEIANPYKYKVTKYIYATSQLKVAQSIIVQPRARDPWCRDSNWMGYVAVATDAGKLVLGRRDILIAWRGTMEPLEWAKDFDFPLVPGNCLFGSDCKAKVHRGILSVYTSDDPDSLYNRTSAREQVLSEVERLVDLYKEEALSITVTGHSLGAALSTLNAADIAAKGLNKVEGTNQICPVTAFCFASPRVGDSNFSDMFCKIDNLHLLRVTNVLDPIPLFTPAIGYVDVGKELMIDTHKSPYLKKITGYILGHILEGYLHGIAGTHGLVGGFELEVYRPLELLNKKFDMVKDEYSVPAAWWTMKNKGMVQMEDGSWKLVDHERESEPY